MGVGQIGFWAVLFVGAHLVISSKTVRPRLLSALGDRPYQGVYSLVSLGTFIPLCIAFGYHKHAGAMLWYLRSIEPLRWLVWLLMLFAIVVLVAGLINPAPSGMAAPGVPQTPSGIQKLTRHPAFVAFSTFGFAHMLMNGWVGDLLFFGSFPALGIFGARHQDTRKAEQLGERYRRFMEQTSFFPGAALFSGRQRWSSADTPWIAIAVGVGLTLILILLHPMLFGGYPLG
jgi:uncharacterized membrane protein